MVYNFEQQYGGDGVGTGYETRIPIVKNDGYEKIDKIRGSYGFLRPSNDSFTTPIAITDSDSIDNIILPEPRERMFEMGNIPV